MEYPDVLQSAIARVKVFAGTEAFLESCGQIPESSQHLVAVYWCNSEILNGGFNQFFFNPTGVLAPEALRGFHAMGLGQKAALLEIAMSVFGPEYPRDEGTRCEVLERLPGETHRFENGSLFYRRTFSFENLDREYYAGLDEVEQRLRTYAAAIASEVPSAAPKSAYDIVTHFRETRGKPYEMKTDFGPRWNDGSDTAAICAMCQIEEMISNGAWPSVYYNRIGWMVPIAARGYRLIGLNAAAERCELAMKMVADAEAAHPDADYTSDEWLASTLMQHIDEPGWDALDDGWYELTKDTYDLAAAYITRMQQP